MCLPYLWSESCVPSVQYKDVLKLGICTSSNLGLIFNHLGLKANFDKVKQQYWYDTGRKSPKKLATIT
jgi:hypothetical protein